MVFPSQPAPSSDVATTSHTPVQTPPHALEPSLQQRSAAVTKAPPTVLVATAGEALFDLIEEADGRLKPCAGGAVYNLTRALGLQGVGTLYLNPLSGDLLGRQLAQGLHDADVALAAPAPVREPSALAIAALDAEGKASYS
ncbi:MAG: hypothetical protein EON49_18850, partial [Acidovorax sp.]